METSKYTSKSSGERDEKLWRIAKRRASFKRHFTTYLVINAFFWAVWFFGTQHRSHYGLPWPVWPMLGWGIGLVFHYMGAYVSTGSSSVEREYEKLKNEEQNK